MNSYWTPLKSTNKKLKELKEKDAQYLKIQNANLENLGAECTLGFIKLKKNRISIELETNELPVEIQVIGINDTRIVALQGEIFVEFGIEIKKLSPFKKTFVISLDNGALPGYVCTEEAILIGGYETDTSLLTGKSGKIMVKTAVELLYKT